MNAFAQNATSTPAPTPSQPNDIPGTDSTSDSVLTDAPISVAPQTIPNLGTPTILTSLIYRVSAKIGILSASGAEIQLPNVPEPASRSINLRGGYIDVTDTAADGTVTNSSWNSSSLTDRYKPVNPDKKGYYNNAIVLDDGDSVVPDPLPRESLATYTQPATDSSDEQTYALGSFFVDDANRIFYTSPTAHVFLALPSDVFDISSVTHIPIDGKIIAEWDKADEDNYHIVGISVDNTSILFDFTPDSSVEIQQILTWVDDSTVLGRISAHGYDAFATINLTQHRFTSKINTSRGQFARVKSGAVTTYPSGVQ